MAKGQNKMTTDIIIIKIVSGLEDELGDTPEMSELTSEFEYFCSL